MKVTVDRLVDRTVPAGYEDLIVLVLAQGLFYPTGTVAGLRGMVDFEAAKKSFQLRLQFIKGLQRSAIFAFRIENYQPSHEPPRRPIDLKVYLNLRYIR